MEGSNWVAEHLLDLLQTVGIVGGLLLAAYTTWKDGRARRVTNAIAINDQHRRIWKDIYEHRDLVRVLDREANIQNEPVTIAEEMFVTTVVAHLSTVFHAIRDGELIHIDELQRDVRDFFTLPIANAVWSKLKSFQDGEFVRFVDQCGSKSRA
ncbi:MAG: hypothetical protein ACXWDN_10055 [Limisphaerales bacterium]